MIYYDNLGYIYKLTLKNEFIHICTEYHSNEIRYIAEIHVSAHEASTRIFINYLPRKQMKSFIGNFVAELGLQHYDA